MLTIYLFCFYLMRELSRNKLSICHKALSVSNEVKVPCSRKLWDRLIGFKLMDGLRVRQANNCLPHEIL